MNFLKENIARIIREIVEKNGYLLIDFNVRGSDSLHIFEVFVDAVHSVTADNCAALSREIASAIDDCNLVSSAYRLDVSSPGTERPLIYPQQFPKHVNRKFEIEYKHNDTLNKATGKLIAVNNEQLTFLINNKDELTLNFNNITTAKVILSFS